MVAGTHFENVILGKKKFLLAKFKIFIIRNNFIGNLMSSVPEIFVNIRSSQPGKH